MSTLHRLRVEVGLLREQSDLIRRAKHMPPHEVDRLREWHEARAARLRLSVPPPRRVPWLLDAGLGLMTAAAAVVIATAPGLTALAVAPVVAAAALRALLR